MTVLEPYLVRPEAVLFLFNVGAASLLLCGLGLLAVRPLGRYPAPLRHGLLLTVLVVLVGSPLVFSLATVLGWGFQLPVATATLDGQKGLPSDPALLVSSDTNDEPSAGARLGDESNPQVTAAHGLPLSAGQALGTLLICVWGIGTVVVAARFARGLETLTSLRATLRAVHDPALTHAAAETCRLLGIKQRVELCQAPLVLIPFSLGLFRPRIILPAGLAERLDEEQVRYVLLHESAHIRRGDHWVALLQCCCTTLFWWNPLLRSLNARLVRLREQICDDYVTWAGGDGRHFAEALVRVAEWGAVRPSALCSAALLDSPGADLDEGNAVCRELEERIVRLVQKKRRRELRMSRSSRAAVMALGMLATAALPIAGLARPIRQWRARWRRRVPPTSCRPSRGPSRLGHCRGRRQGSSRFWPTGG